MYYKSNPSNYTRCEKCKYIDRKKEECKITNDKWLVPDNAGTCHQFEEVEKMEKAYEITKNCGVSFEKANKSLEKVVLTANTTKPNYYKAGKFDVISFCFEHDLDFATGNIIKYVTRAGKKDKNKTLEDLEKAMEYLRRKIERVKEEN